MDNIEIRKAVNEDFDQIWPIFQAVVQKGDSYVYLPTTTKNEAKAIWMSELLQTFVAEIDDEIVGTYIMRPNFPGLASHVANCSYMVNHNWHGRGIGKNMGLHSIEFAKSQGFKSMQFNIVVSTNTAAVKLWHSLGFTIIGTSPKAFLHQQLGYVDTFIMHREI